MVLLQTRYRAYDPDAMLARILSAFAKFRKNENFNELDSLIMPIMVTVHEGTEKKTTQPWFFGKPIEYNSPVYQYAMNFPRELTEREVTLWRMFIVGVFANIR